MSEAETEWQDREHDWAAVQERLAFLLYQFATKGIGEKIRVDALAADNAIRYCRERIAGAPFHPACEARFLISYIATAVARIG